MKKYIYIIIGILFLQFSTVDSFSQKGGVDKKVKKEVKKQQKSNAKALKSSERYGKKRHLSIQDKATRKRMKQNLKNSNRSGVGR